MLLVAASTVGLWALAAAAIGLGLVPSARPAARWFAFVLALAFAVTAAMAVRTEPRELSPRGASAQLAGAGDGSAVRTAMLIAASAAGPRADELLLQWRAPFAAGASPTAALGARSEAPPALPWAPADVQLRAVGGLAQDRPTMLEVSVPTRGDTFVAELVVRSRDGEVLRERIRLGAGGTASVPFVPAAVGNHEVIVTIDVDGHRMTASGRFEIAPAEQVLVVEPGGVAAAALRAQGVRVRATPALPGDWAQHRRIVLGELLPRDQQEELVAAVLDGTGLFVLSPGFGQQGSPLRSLLPVRPLPQQPRSEQGDGTGPPTQLPPTEPPTEPPVESPPPTVPPPVPPPDEGAIGDTRGSKPVSAEPIEVDKHSIAMVLVVDRSGSMGNKLANGLTKMSYAKTSALRTAKALGVGDRVGIVTFGDKGFGRIELPLMDATDEIRVQAGIEKLAHAQEFTFLLSGLRLAHGMLQQQEAAVKHVVVVTDGEYQVSESVALRAEANRMRREGKITVSMISIVDRSTDPQFQLEAELLTRDGGGQYLPIEDPAAVPVLVSAEVTRALSRVGRKPRRPGDGNQPPTDTKPDEPPPPVESPVAPPPEQQRPPPVGPRRLPVRAVAESALLAPDPDVWPTLGGAVATEAPLEARVLLVAGDEGWPLLAYANRGLGRIGAFAADLAGDAGAEFRQDERFPAWIAQWVAATMPAQASQQPRDLRETSAVEPPAPVPADIAWLSSTGGAPPQAPDGEPVAAVVGRSVRDQVADWAPWLLLGVLLLAMTERATAASALRRGRN